MVTVCLAAKGTVNVNPFRLQGGQGPGSEHLDWPLAPVSTTTAILGLVTHLCGTFTCGIIKADQWVSGGPEEITQLKV